MADSSPEGEFRDTLAGLLHRSGPTRAELLDPDTGTVFIFDFAEAARTTYASGLTGEELADRLFPQSPDNV